MADRLNDIEKYLRGELSASEMHELEKKALTDPFLADALEGASQLPAEQFAHDIDLLTARLTDKTSKKVIPLWIKVSRIAAIFLAVVLSAFVIFQIIKTERRPELAQRGVQSPDAVASEKTDSVVKKDEGKHGPLALNDKLQEEASAIDKKPGAEKNLQTEKTDNLSRNEAETITHHEEPLPEEPLDVEIPELIRDEDLKKSIAQQSPQQDAGKVSKYEAPDRDRARAAVQPSVAGRLADVEAVRRSIRGKVTDAVDGKGVPGVNVMIKGTNTGTVTNAEGNYEISTDDSNKNLVFSFIGYESKEVDAGAGTEVNVSLDQDIAELSEVVVVGYGAYGEGKTDEKYSTFEMATPAGGRKAFKQYLEQNIQYPEQALKNNVEGKVTVQFTVETSGRLSGFKVIKGIGYGCDEELIRLIKQGPQWAPTKRDTAPLRDRVKVRMKFSIPKK